MDASNQEFCRLLSESGWNQSEAARKLDLKPASVSRYVNNIDKPSHQTLRLFRMMVLGGDALREDVTQYKAAPRPTVVSRLRGHVAEIENLLAEVKSTIKDLEK